jgi:hypothetical protein
VYVVFLLRCLILFLHLFSNTLWCLQWLVSTWSDTAQAGLMVHPHANFYLASKPTSEETVEFSLENIANAKSHIQTIQWSLEPYHVLLCIPLDQNQEA